MHSFVARIGGATVAALVIVTTTFGASQWREWRGHGDSPKQGMPCADGLVAVEREPGCPLQVDVRFASCRMATNTVWVQYGVTNVGTKQIQGFHIQTSERYERQRSDSQGVGFAALTLGAGSEYEAWMTCTGKVDPEVGDPGRLTALVLSVTQVQFADGTTWRRPVTTKVPPE